MTEKQFEYGETDLFEWVEDNGEMISTKECVNKLNEQQATINELKEELKLEQDFALRWQKESEMLAKENEQLRTQLLLCQQSKDGRFQVWEEPPIPKGKRITFTINNGGGDGV